MSKSTTEFRYNNNILSYNGKLSRLAYIIQNSLVMIFAFQYMYYPHLYGTILDLQSRPELASIFAVYKQFPQYHEFLASLKAAANPSLTDIIIRYLFLIPLRVIDIKRVRDIVNRNLTGVETTMVAVIFSLPFVDLLSTLFLAVIPANKHAKNPLVKEIKQADMHSAQVEKYLQLNQKLFESGKISRADYLKARDKYKS